MSAIQLPDILSKTATCIIEKVETHSFQGFSNYVKQHFIKENTVKKSVTLKIVMSASDLTAEWPLFL